MTTSPDLQTVLKNMEAGLGSLPAAIRLAATADPAMVLEQARSSGFAMPVDGALDPETRTLIYLAAALAASNHACVAAMTNKARLQGIAPQKQLEAFHIARYALATRVVGDAEPLLAELAASAGSEAA
jgi:alkylhydroperoxidase/carboxymuconolactone decarboxylase family protein YurZ